MRRLALLALGVLVAACGEDEQPSRPPAAPDTRLTVTVWPQGPGGERRIRTITCIPQTRRMPCLRLDETTVEGFAPVPDDVACTAIYGGPATATVTGRLRGRRVDARFDLRSGCEIARWGRLAWLLGAPPPNVRQPP
jgi:hypothetical protein